jgi:putative iron-regulated protein
MLSKENIKWQARLSPRYIPVLLLAGLCALGTGCETTTPSAETSTSSESTASQPEELKFISDFPDQVVIPTYELLVQKSKVLKTAVDAFVATPNDTTLKAAQTAWIETRLPWEKSEAFAFGPAESLGYDGDLDDWPVNETDLKAVLAGSEPITPEKIKSLQTTQKGFHSIELLLFGTNNNKKAADFSAREQEYLKQLTAAFDQTANDLVASWSKGIDGKPAYKTVLATAGQADNEAYPTPQAAKEEIVQGIIGCLDEVGNEKIGVPLKAKTTDDLESRYSYNSAADFKSNLIGAQNAYLGKAPDAEASDASLSTWVAKKDANLDAQIKKEMQAAIDAVAAIPSPLEPKMTDAAALAKLKTAQDSVLAAFSTFEGKVLPLVQKG